MQVAPTRTRPSLARTALDPLTGEIRAALRLALDAHILPSEYVGVLVRGSTIVLVVGVTVGTVRVFV